MQATARRLSVVSVTSCARRRLIRDVRPSSRACRPMPWNFDTKQFDPPLTLAGISTLSSPTDQVFHLEDFVFFKSNQLKLPLSRAEMMFRDTAGLHGEILSDGWHSPFYQIYSWDQFSDIIEVLNHCGHQEAAKLLADARHIFYRGRSDLKTEEDRLEAGIDGWHLTPQEKERFHDIGEAFEKLAETAYYPDLVKWFHAHQEDFSDFPR